ncbi:MAG: DUF3108 domain-containing protein [Planctomycetota bacterium]
MLTGVLTLLLLINAIGDPNTAIGDLINTSDEPIDASDDPIDGDVDQQQSNPIPGYAREDLAKIVPAALPLGERLIFKATVEWKGAQVLVGHFELAAWTDSSSNKILHGRGKGERFGYKIDQRIVTVLDSTGVQPISFFNMQRGSEHHTKKLIFGNEQIEYLKQSHCRGEDCNKPEHRVSEVAWKGPIPWGTEKSHCTEKDCKNPKHEIWSVRETHVVDEPYVDLLTAIYVARTATFPSDGKPLLIPVVNDDSRWLVKVEPLKQEKLIVPEGEYEAIELSLTPYASDGDQKKRFQGLFGIHGTLRVWIDSITGKPLLIEGTLPISILNLKARIELISSGDAEVVKTRHNVRNTEQK